MDGVEDLSTKMYDANGNIVLCKCGKPAGAGIMGKESYIFWCSECSPMPKETAEIVYRPPNDEKQCAPLLDDAWKIDWK